jgi:hypothetical protein
VGGYNLCGWRGIAASKIAANGIEFVHHILAEYSFLKKAACQRRFYEDIFATCFFGERSKEETM